MYCFMAIPDALLPVNSQDSAGSEAAKGGTCSVIWHSFKCSSCGNITRLPGEEFIMTSCAHCAALYARPDSSDGVGVRVVPLPIGSLTVAPQKPLRYGPIDTVAASNPLKLAPPIQVPVRDVEMKFVSGPTTAVDRTEGVVEIDATVDGLDRHTCWVRWDENRRALEGGRGYAVRRLTADQIAAAKLYQRVLWTREREMNGPPRPSRPRLTILVDQDIED
jgi:hypothetical protein